ncbi:MAG: hypothetical protein Q7R96_03525 [Nanoarchaeota archaeon]|nr:hypothetical protein [Nanoarchaeota archaeon]
MKGKRGVDVYPTADAAGFILMLLLFFAIYIVLLPTNEKAELMQDDSVYGVGSYDYTTNNAGYTYGYEGTTGTTYKVLFSETPGKVYPYLDDNVLQPLTSVSLSIDEAAQNIKLAESLTISKSAWKDNSKTVTFALPTGTVSKAQLYFFLAEREGSITIKINGAEIYSGEITSSSIPINVPLTYLRSNNRITFEVEGPGINIFGSNSYRITEVLLKTQQATIHNEESRSFTLTENEYQTLEGITLSYFTNCRRIEDRGILTITLNNKLVDERQVVCEIGPIAQDISIENVRPGINTLMFNIDAGSYILEQMFIEKYVSQKTFQRYTYSVQPNEYEDIHAGYVDAVLTLHMKESYRKVANIIINGVVYYVDTTDDTFPIDVSDAIVEGQNSIKIIPRNEFDILNLELALEE